MIQKQQPDWDNLVELFLKKDASLSPAAFCEMHGVSVYEMNLHYKQIMRERSSDHVSCVDISRSAQKSSYLILDLDGIRIKLNKNFDHELLRETIEVLRSC